MGWVRSYETDNHRHLQVEMPGQALWLRPKVQHAPSLPFAHGFFQVIWRQSICHENPICCVFLTQKSPKRRNSAANQGTFFDKIWRRSHEIPGRSVCSFRGVRCCGLTGRPAPWCSKFLRPALTLAMKKLLLYRKFRQWMRENEKLFFGNLSVAGLAKNWKLRVRIYPCTIHRHCFCPIFPPEKCRSCLDNSRACLTSWKRALVHLHPKSWLMDVCQPPWHDIFFETFLSEGLHTWPFVATKKSQETCRNGWYAPTGATSMKPGDSQIAPIFGEKNSTHQLRPGSCCSMKLWWKFRWSPTKKVWKNIQKPWLFLWFCFVVDVIFVVWAK